jgi:transcription antitermination factor NusG
MATLRKDALVQLKSGPHARLYGRVVDLQEEGKATDKAQRAVSIRLNISKEVVPAIAAEADILDEQALPPDHPAFATEAAAAPSALEASLWTEAEALPASGSGSGSGSSKSKAKSSSSAAGAAGSAGSKKRSRSRSRSGSDSDEAESDEKAKAKLKKAKGKKERDKGKKKKKEKDLKPIKWVRPHLRVRCVSHTPGGGAHYNQKGRVEDVIDRFRFTLVMDGGRLLENMKEKYVETLVPAQGKKVMVLKGEYKGEQGKILEKHPKEARAVVQLDSDLQVTTLSFDDICEVVEH